MEICLTASEGILDECFYFVDFLADYRLGSGRDIWSASEGKEEIGHLMESASGSRFSFNFIVSQLQSVRSKAVNIFQMGEVTMVSLCLILFVNDCQKH